MNRTQYGIIMAVIIAGMLGIIYIMPNANAGDPMVLDGHVHNRFSSDMDHVTYSIEVYTDLPNSLDTTSYKNLKLAYEACNTYHHINTNKTIYDNALFQYCISILNEVSLLIALDHVATQDFLTVKSFEKVIQGQEDMITGLDNKIEQQDAQIFRLTDKIIGLNANITDRDNKITELQDKIDKKNQLLENKDNRIEKLQQELQDKQNKIDQLRQKLKELQN